MLDGEELIPGEYIILIDEELRRLKAEDQKANFQEKNDTTKPSKCGFFARI